MDPTKFKIYFILVYKIHNGNNYLIQKAFEIYNKKNPMKNFQTWIRG
jgi:hypothetical protein